MSCHDVYVLAGQGCHIIETYPSAVHPPSGRVRPTGPGRKVRQVRHPRDAVYDEDALIATALLELL